MPLMKVENEMILVLSCGRGDTAVVMPLNGTSAKVKQSSHRTYETYI